MYLQNSPQKSSNNFINWYTSEIVRFIDHAHRQPVVKQIPFYIKRPKDYVNKNYFRVSRYSLRFSIIIIFWKGR